MRERTKEVTIGEHKYRIGQWTAEDGSWILMQVMTKLMPMSLGEVDSDLPAGRTQLSEGEFKNIQRHCLGICQRYVNGAPMPVYAIDGRKWGVQDLEYDLVTVMKLTVHAITHNLSPFFSENGLRELLQGSLSDSVPSDSPPSTHSHGARS